MQFHKQFESADRNSPPKQQKGVELSIKDNNTKGNLYSTYDSRKNLVWFSFSITVRDISNRTCMTASKFENEVLKIVNRTVVHGQLKVPKQYSFEWDQVKRLSK